MSEPTQPVHDTETKAEKYVGFCDILGFSEKTLTDFEETQRLYEEFSQLMLELEMPSVTVAIYSDSIILTSDSFPDILQATQNLWFFALHHRFMLRGAITKGRYWEKRHQNHLLVVSDALIRAVKLEKLVKVPAIVIADDVEIPEEYWAEWFRLGVATPLLYFRDRAIVNPFNLGWLKTAGTRAEVLMRESPAHKDKYLWFLALHAAVTTRQELIPPGVVDSLLAKGILTRESDGAESA